jgi:hypothetical protein
VGKIMILTMSIGCDGKLNLILNTIRVSINYCKKIIIVDSGNWIINPNVEQILTSISDKIVYVKNITSELNFQFTSYNMIYDLIEDEEWFIYLDADERLSKNTMRDWNYITDYIQCNKYNIGLIVGMCHIDKWKNFDEDKMFEIEDSLLFKKPIIVKKCKDVRVTYSSNHCSFTDNDKHLYISKINKSSPYFYTHLKTSFQNFHGVILCSHNNMEHICVESTNSYYKDIKSLNIKHGLNTNNDLVKYIVINNDFPDEILDYYDTCINSDNNQISHYYPNWSKWIRKMKTGIDVPFNNLRDNLVYYCNESIYCNKTCCNYDDTQL